VDAFEFEFLAWQIARFGGYLAEGKSAGWYGRKIAFPMSREEKEPEAAIVLCRHLERMPKSKRPRD